jgi:uncharacterized protein (DUF983 family)
MVTETNEITYSDSSNRPPVNQFKQRRRWIHCPRCIGGSMYQEYDGEYVCVQCGCSYDPNKGTKTPQLVNNK